MKNFRPYPEPEDYLDLEEDILTSRNADLYQEIEDEIVDEKTIRLSIGRIDPVLSLNDGYTYDCTPDCCYCQNYPSNGGSCICHCTLPYFQQTTPQWTVTCGTSRDELAVYDTSGNCSGGYGF